MKRSRGGRHRKLTEAQFERLLRQVRADISDLHLNEKVFSGVVEHLTKYSSVGHQFPAFFGAFYSAMRTDLIIRLGRVYDPEGTGHDSCTLGRCLSTLLESPEFFSEAAITARLREDYRQANPDYLRLHQLDEKQIEYDLQTLVSSREKLVRLRHKLYAHKDLETVLGGARGDLLSTHEEVKALIKLAHEVWNRCSSVWNACTWSDNVIGGEDYEWLFECLRRGLKVKEMIYRRQWRRLSNRASQPRRYGRASHEE